LPLGEAFQLRDDVLGIFGDPSETGKPAGDDLREGKRTVLLAKTMELASKSDQDLIESCLGDQNLSPEKVEEIRKIIKETGALAKLEELITSLTNQALLALNSIDLNPAALDPLQTLANVVTNRKI
jgi:geranylgeranyl diphosphate synthase type I